MNDRSRVALFALVLLGVAAVVAGYLVLGRGGGERELVGDREGLPVFTGGGPSGGDGPVGEAGEPGAGTPPPMLAEPGGDRPVSNEPEKQAIAPASLFLSGRVIDLKSGAPVDPFHLVVEKAHKQETQFRFGSAGDYLFNESVSDEEGRFTVPIAEPGSFDLVVYSPCHKGKPVPGVSVLRDAAPVDLEIRLDPGFCIPGRVVDDATGEPVSWVLIGIPGLYGTSISLVYSENFAMVRHAWSDEEGNFVIGGFEEEPQRIVAVHEDYAQGCVDVAPGETGPFEIRLKKGPCIFGRALDAEGDPCTGVTIELQGDEQPLRRSVETGFDGKYRTPPMNPGRVDMCAFIKGGPGAGPGGRFFPEWKSVVAADQDVEVDFGLPYEFVTWSGTLYGTEGEILAGANITIDRISSQRKGNYFGQMNQRTASTDQQGAFKFWKLCCGGYEVSVRPAGGTYRGDVMTVHLEAPGEVIRDISLAPGDVAACGTVRGVLIDGATGSPIAGGGNRFQGGQYGHVILSPVMPPYTVLTTYTDGKGQFEFTGIAPGSYGLLAQASGFPDNDAGRLEIKAGDVINDLRIVMSAGGELRVRLDGFLPTDPRTFEVYFANDQGKEWYIGGEQLTLWPDGTWEYTSIWDAGVWTVRVLFEEMGLAEQQCRVVPGGKGEARFRRDDFQSDGKPITVAGRIARADGSPLPGVTIRFDAPESAGEGRGGMYLQVVTDADGAFSLDGFRPGRWAVTALLDGGVTPGLPDLVLTSHCDNPHTLNLVVESGTVSGTLVNGLTGISLQPGSEWWVVVRDVDGNRDVAKLKGGHREAQFELKGVPACRFTATVNTREFFEQTTPVFTHTGHGNVDVGRIVLEPCGVLDLFVSDQDGGAVDGVQLFVDGKEIHLRCWQGAEGSLRYDKFNLGPAAVAVSASGYRTYEAEVSFKPGIPVRVNVVLEKR